MSLITRGSVLSALRPGVHAWWGLGYDRYKDEYSEIYETLRSEMNYERDVNVYGFGPAVVKPEGTASQFDTMAEGFHYNYVHIPYSTGFIITHEAMQDNLYMKLAEQNTKEIGRSMKETKEVVGANLLNLAFSSTLTYADGLSLCNTANLLSGGGTFANRPSVDADLSELALEQALINIGGYTDDRSKKTKIMARKLIIPKELQHQADRILKSELQADSANHNINSLRAGGYIPEGYAVNHYLTSPSSWFIITDCSQGMQHFVREDVRIDTDNEFATDNILVKAYERYSFGCTDKRSIYGSNGP